MDKGLMKKLTEAFGPSGREDAVRALIQNEIAAYCDELTVDSLGNLIAHKKGNGKKLLFMSHMDVAGLIVTEVDEKGFLRVMNVGDIAPTAAGRKVRFANGAKGVCYYGTGKDFEKADLYDMFVDLGVAGRDAARELADISDMAMFDEGFTDMGVRVAGTGVADRAGCAVLIDLLKKNQSDADLYVVFTSQERVGGRAASAACYDIMPDYAVIVHAGVAGDYPGAERACLKLGAGPAIEAMDRSAIVPVSMRRKLIDAAKAALVPYQLDALRPDGSDTAGVQRTKTGVFTGVISIPTRYLGSAAETIDLGDVENAVKLLRTYCETEA